MEKTYNILRYKHWLLLFALIFVLFGCKDDDDNNGNNNSNCEIEEITPYSANNNVIYEANLRNYSTQSNFKGLENDLCRLKNMGVDIIWLMPVHPIGKVNRLGSKGSPYSIVDYKAINPEFGTEADFRSLIRKAHEYDMQIWMDWVANHTAWDHPWVKTNIDFYATSSTGERPYSPEDWSDVIQLDYNNQELQDVMIDAMKYWVREFDIDGYRCDAATYVPLAFWRKAKTAVNEIKEITWLCEGDSPTYMSVFDCDYAWGFNDALNSFGENKDVATLKTQCERLFNHGSYKKKSRMVYLTNHDLNAYEGTEFKRYGDFVLPLTILSFTIYDLPLIYNGQEIGFNKVMNLFDTRFVEWKRGSQSYAELFKKLSKLRRTHAALENGENRGELKFYETTNSKVLAFSRTKDNKEIVVLLNFSEQAVQVKFTTESPSGVYQDYLSEGEITINNNTTISLPVNGYVVYVK